MLDHSRCSESGTTRSFAKRVPGPGLLPLLSAWSPVADKFGALNSKARHIGEGMLQGWLEFISDRLAKDITLPQQLVACKNPNEVYCAYSQFWQQAAKDYANEYTAMTDAFWAAVRSPLAVAQSDSEAR